MGVAESKTAQVEECETYKIRLQFKEDMTLEEFLAQIGQKMSPLAQEHEWETKGLQCRVEDTQWIPHEEDKEEASFFDQVKMELFLCLKDEEIDREKKQKETTKTLNILREEIHLDENDSAEFELFCYLAKK